MNSKFASTDCNPLSVGPPHPPVFVSAPNLFLADVCCSVVRVH